MRLPKTVDSFVSSLNDMLAEGQDVALADAQTLKTINRLLGAVAPGFCIVTVQSIENKLLGFSAQQTPTHEHSTHSQGAPGVKTDEE